MGRVYYLFFLFVFSRDNLYFFQSQCNSFQRKKCVSQLFFSIIYLEPVGGVWGPITPPPACTRPGSCTRCPRWGSRSLSCTWLHRRCSWPWPCRLRSRRWRTVVCYPWSGPGHLTLKPKGKQFEGQDNPSLMLHVKQDYFWTLSLFS